MRINNFFKLVIAIAVSEAAGIIGATALTTGGSSNVWYAGLTKPALNQPAWTMFIFYKISKQAAYLLVPYLLWVSFASYLNYSILMLN